MIADEYLMTDQGLAAEIGRAIPGGNLVWSEKFNVIFALLERARDVRLAVLADGERLKKIPDQVDEALRQDWVEGISDECLWLLQSVLDLQEALRCRVTDEPVLEAAAITGEAKGRREALKEALEAECPECVTRWTLVGQPRVRDDCKFCRGSGYVLTVPAPKKGATEE